MGRHTIDVRRVGRREILSTTMLSWIWCAFATAQLSLGNRAFSQSAPYIDDGTGSAPHADLLSPAT